MLAHVDNSEDCCLRFVAACKRRLLGTYAQLKRGELRRNGGVFDLLHDVAKSETPIEWTETLSEDLFLKSPPETRSTTFHRPHVLTRLYDCAFCNRKKSAAHKLLTCGACRDAAFCGPACQKAALKQKKHPKDCGPPFRPKPSAYRRAVVDFVLSALAVASHLVARGVWKGCHSRDNDPLRSFSSLPVEQFLGVAACCLFELAPVEGHNVVAMAFQLDAIDPTCSGGYRDWLLASRLPVVPQDRNIHVVADNDSIARALNQVQLSKAALDRKAFHRFLKPIANAATTFDADLYASIDEHYSRTNSVGRVPPLAEPLRSFV